MIILKINTKKDIDKAELAYATTNIIEQSNGKAIAYFERDETVRGEIKTYYFCLSYPMENTVITNMLKMMLTKQFQQADRQATLELLKRLPQHMDFTKKKEEPQVQFIS